MSVREGEGVFVNDMIAGEHKPVLNTIPIMTNENLNTIQSWRSIV